MNGTQAKVCLFVAIFKFKVALLDRVTMVTQTVQTHLRSDPDYNTTIGSVRGYRISLHEAWLKAFKGLKAKVFAGFTSRFLLSTFISLN